MKKGKVMISVAIVLVIGFGYFKGMGIYSEKKQIETGVKKGTLMECPDKPNCVSTTNSDEKHAIKPIDTILTLEEINTKLEQFGLSLIKTDGNYSHFTFKSKIMGYVDDIEVMLNGDKLSIRSASRVGYSDMGANRKRVEKIRDYLNN